MRILRFMVGLILCPLCLAASRTLYGLLVRQETGGGAFLGVPGFVVAGGCLLWLVVYFGLPTPVRAYVLAHELTHALWGALMGARVSRLKISKSGGSVSVSKNNVVITLAPYFFPLYTVIVVAGYCVLSLFYNVERWQVVWLVLIGFTWAFHLTFTAITLLQHQPDIQLYGRLFSYSVIYLVNVLGVCVWLVAVSGPTTADLIRTLVDDTTWVLLLLVRGYQLLSAISPWGGTL